MVLSDNVRVGLTFFITKSAGSIWNNGAFQQGVFLWMLLRGLPSVEVIAINGGDGDVPQAGLMLKNLGINFVRMVDVVDSLDVLIEAGAQVEAAHVARVRARGGRAVTYKFGNSFVIDAERCIHGKEAGGIFNGSCFDEVWTNPQHVNTCRSYWELTYRCPVRVLPQVWEPTFVDAASAEMPVETPFGYQPGKKKKNVAIFEPNFNIVKTCFIPMLICEQAYRRAPDLIGQVFVTNAERLTNHLTFRTFVEALDIGRHKLADGGSICSFEARYNTPWFMAKHGDVVVSHQWENSLNFLYYDALYGNYPLVHNAALPKGVGYHYAGFDAHDGGNALVAALMTHDVPAQRLEYEKAAHEFLDTVRIGAQTNIDEYSRALGLSS